MNERDTRAPASNVPLSGIDANYRHYPKRVTPDTALVLPQVVLKWYALAREREPVPDVIRTLAREHVESESSRGRLEARGLGFTILHRCGESFYFLIVNSWNHSNEIWETVYYKDGEAMTGFALFPRERDHKPTYCVWELGAVWHEQQAWSRFLSSARSEADVQAYLADRMSGAV